MLERDQEISEKLTGDFDKENVSTSCQSVLESTSGFQRLKCFRIPLWFFYLPNIQVRLLNLAVLQISIFSAKFELSCHTGGRRCDLYGCRWVRGVVNCTRSNSLATS